MSEPKGAFFAEYLMGKYATQSTADLLNEHNCGELVGTPLHNCLVRDVVKWVREAVEAETKPLVEALESAAIHLEEMRKDPRWHPVGHCPVLDMVRAALAKQKKT